MTTVLRHIDISGTHIIIKADANASAFIII